MTGHAGVSATVEAYLRDSGAVDEPTAHLDAPLARQVMSGLHAATSWRGLLVVTHASEPELSDFDSVVALEGGLLAKVGEDDLPAAQATPRATLEKA